MSSYLAKQTDAFRRDAMAAAPKITSKHRNLAPPPPESAPSPAPSNASNSSRTENKDAKRKRETTTQPFSQPDLTGFGFDPKSQAVFTVDFLKKKDEPKTLKEILDFLSLHNSTEDQKKGLVKALQENGHIRWIPDPELKIQKWDSGTFAHKPIIGNVRTKDELIAHLQARADAQGIRVKDLKDGWWDCEDAIDELDKEHKILATRDKKNSHAMYVWSNDPTLHHDVDSEFQVMWHKIELPSVDDLVRKLIEAGQKPASEDPSKRVKAAPKPKDKKKRAQRKGGKTTNTHMQHLLRDFSHMKR